MAETDAGAVQGLLSWFKFRSGLQSTASRIKASRLHGQMPQPSAVMQNGVGEPTFSVKGQSDATDPDHRDIDYRICPIDLRPAGACLSITWFKPRTRLPTIRFSFSVQSNQLVQTRKTVHRAGRTKFKAESMARLGVARRMALVTYPFRAAVFLAGEKKKNVAAIAA